MLLDDSDIQDKCQKKQIFSYKNESKRPIQISIWNNTSNLVWAIKVSPGIKLSNASQSNLMCLIKFSRFC